MKLVGYARVSTEQQVEEGLGLEVQRKAIKDWASRHDYGLARIVADEGLSGTRPALDRPGLAETLALIEDRKVSGLLVYGLHRLARTLAIQEATLAHVWRAGGRVFTVEAGEVLEDDPEDPMRRAMRQMMGVFHELDRGMIAARLRAGRRLKASRGGYAYGAPGFGYAAARGALVPVPSEQRTLQRIQELRAEGLSIRETARTLEEEGLYSKRGNRWNPGTLARIISRSEQTA